MKYSHTKLIAWLVAMLFLLTATSQMRSRILAQDNPPAARKLALLVGVKEYDHPELHKLNFTENDVDELAKVLTDQGFEVTLLTTVRGQKSADFKPTAANIRIQLQKVIAKASRRDLVLVGFSGHGLQPLESRDSFFCPADAVPVLEKGKLTDPQTLISIQETLAMLRRSKVGLKLLLVDACRTDPSVKGSKGVDDVSIDALPPQTGILLSCSPGEYSFEHKSLGTGHGAFFYHVIEGLKGEAGGGGTDVTWESLRSYVRTRVPAKVNELYGKDGGEQNPNEIGNLRGRPAVLAVIRKKAQPGIEPAPATEDTPSAPPDPFDGLRAGQFWDNNRLNTRLVWCPAGSFVLGSPKDEEGRADDEGPLKVTLTKGFWLGEHEVTQEEWRKLMPSIPWSGKPNAGPQPDCPANYVSWGDAMAFCGKVTKADAEAGRLPAGWSYSLPTEAQWEYGCRAGSATRFSFQLGEADLPAYGWFHANTDTANERFPHRVAQKGGNAWKLRDMHGNVAEWCFDHYQASYGDSPLKDPHGPEQGKYHVVRGGSWDSVAGVCGSAHRESENAESRFSTIGFRLVCTRSAR